MKKLLSFVLCSLLIISASVPVSAAVEYKEYQPRYIIITPYYVNIDKATSTLSISSNGQATIKGIVEKTPSGSTIYVTATLQRANNNSWEDIKSWSTSSTSSAAWISEKHTVSKGKYRVATSFMVYGTGGAESGTVYSKTVTY